MKPLREINPGERFMYGGVTWVRLPYYVADSEPPYEVNSALAIAETPVFEWAFDIYNRNDWRESTLRQELNGRIFNNMVDEGADPNAFLEFMSDLTADDGTTDYENAKDRIAIPSAKLYRTLRSSIPKYEGIWWTLTPLTCNVENSIYVKVIMPDGTITKREANFEMAGIRPVCLLKSETPVFTEKEEKQIRRKTSVKEGAEAVMEALEEYGTALWGDIVVEVVKAIFAMKTDSEALAQEIKDTRKALSESEAPDGA